jgi:hypothetical protein
MPAPPRTKLDAGQVLAYAFDDTTGRLRIDGTGGGVSHTTDSVAIGDGTDLVTTTTVGADVGLDVNIINSGLAIAIDNTSDSIAIGDETNIVDMQQMDAAFGTSSWGFPIFGIRRDADTSPVSTDGDAHPLVFDENGNLKVTAVDIDIRDLDASQDSVEVFQATHDDLNANANIQVGDADVDNANPVPVSDAGGSLTIDNTNLDTPLSNLETLLTSIEANQLPDSHNVTVDNASGAAAVNIQDGGNSITVDASDLDIRDLSDATDSVSIGDGTDTLAVNNDGSINVEINGDTVILDGTTPHAVVNVGTTETTIAVTTKTALQIGPAGDNADTDIYYWNYDLGTATVAATGWPLKAGEMLTWTADKGEDLSITISIAKSTGTGNIVVGRLDK